MTRKMAGKLQIARKTACNDHVPSSDNRHD
jgi:hypothetical protein